LLAISEALKYFKHMLLGHRIIVRTDHKNLTHPDTNHVSDRVLCQRLLLEEYGAEIEYIKVEKNVVADALSRLPTQELFLFDDAGDEEFPLNLQLIADYQQNDEYLQTQLRANSKKYYTTARESVQLYTRSDTAAIYVPAALRAAILQWYHATLQHPGVKHMQATVQENFYWPCMDAAVESLVPTCAICQQCKLTAVKKYGKITLPVNTKVTPWEEVHVNLVGPWDLCFNITSIQGKQP
jgi:hypothetical protein